VEKGVILRRKQAQYGDVKVGLREASLNFAPLSNSDPICGRESIRHMLLLYREGSSQRHTSAFFLKFALRVRIGICLGTSAEIYYNLIFRLVPCS
jgi:hypothetical protein